MWMKNISRSINTNMKGKPVWQYFKGKLMEMLLLVAALTRWTLPLVVMTLLPLMNGEYLTLTGEIRIRTLQGLMEIQGRMVAAAVVMEVAQTVMTILF